MTISSHFVCLGSPSAQQRNSKLGATLGGQNNLPFREYTHRALAFNGFKAQNIREGQSDCLCYLIAYISFSLLQRTLR